MKTSYILLAVVTLLTLTGMIATDVLLKQEYDKIDWKNPYQGFAKKSLPMAKHWVIEGTPTKEIMILKSADSSQALIDPDERKFYRTRQQGDTVFVAYTPDYNGNQSGPRNAADYELGIPLVLRLPSLQTLRVKNGRLTIRDFSTDNLTVNLMNSRLRTHGITVSNAFDLITSQNSFAVLGEDKYQSLNVTVQDSSGVQLNNTQTETFTKIASPKSEVQLRGQALKWLK
jgi:hypothetical protein